MTERRRRKCLNCQRLFRPDPRNVRRQRYCSDDLDQLLHHAETVVIEGSSFRMKDANPES